MRRCDTLFAASVVGAAVALAMAAATCSAAGDTSTAGVNEAAAAPHRAPFDVASDTKGNCSVYTKTSNNCANNCGCCFNPGSRAGVICKGQQTGYYCPADSPPVGADMAFACMDWTFGSMAMQKAEATYNGRSGQPAVYFGVGSYGTSSDPQRGLGACYQLGVTGIDRPLLVQSVNTGSDVQGTQFDMQVGDGGAGAFNTCAGSSSSMYPGSYAAWGKQYGGVDDRSQCAGLPQYPQVSGPMKAAGDSLVALCEYSFDKGARIEGGGNPSIQNVSRVKCPSELVEFTQFQRSDDPEQRVLVPVVEPSGPGTAAQGQGAESEMAQVQAQARAGRDLGQHTCQDAAGGSLAWCLTRMMDCRKPSGGFKDNVQSSLMVPGFKVLQPCLSDGYTRIDVQCGCSDCYC